MTYSVEDVLSNLNHGLGAVLAGGAVIFVSYYLYLIEAVRLGFKHRTHAVPLFGNMFFFAHDVTFLLLYQRWFHGVDHWLFPAFWFGFLPFTALECVVHYQTLRYSRRELFPTLTSTQSVLAYGCLQLAIIVLFWFIRTQLDDPLYSISICSTVILSVALGMPFLHARRSRRGQSHLRWEPYCGPLRPLLHVLARHVELFRESALPSHGRDNGHHGCRVHVVAVAIPALVLDNKVQ